jgi:hypothetical protein
MDISCLKHTCMHTYIGTDARKCARACMYACMHACVQIHTHTCACIFACISTQMCERYTLTYHVLDRYEHILCKQQREYRVE